MIEITLPPIENRPDEPEKASLTPEDIENIREGRKIPTIKEIEHPEVLGAVVYYLEHHADDAKRAAMTPEISRYLNFLDNREKLDDIALETLKTRLKKYRMPIAMEGAGIIGAATLAGMPVAAFFVLGCVSALLYLPKKGKKLQSENAKAYEELRKRLLRAIQPK